MRVQKLHITNFRGFKDLTFEPPPDLAVLIGVNGSGKSTVLDALAILLSQYILRVSSDTISGFSFTENDIYFDSKSSRLFLKTNADYSDISHHWEIAKFRQRGDGVFSEDFIDDGLFELIKEGLRVEQFPVLAYYPSYGINAESISNKDKNLEVEKHRLNASWVAAYERALSGGVSSFYDFFNWFESEESYENESRLRYDNDFKSPCLEVVRLAIQTFLSQFPDVHFGNLRVVRQKNNMYFGSGRRLSEPALIIDKDDREISLNKLSSGEKSLLMLVFDIARRLAILNIKEAETNAKDVLVGTGIALIDEIDLHLHPAWQRAVIPGLRKTFPNLQLIVTTHSPQVLSNVPRKNVFVLEEGQIWSADSHTLGRDSNAILSELMGVSERPIETQQKIDACFQLIDDGHLDQAEESVDELEKTLGRFDTEVVRARTLIGFLSRRADEEN